MPVRRRTSCASSNLGPLEMPSASTLCTSGTWLATMHQPLVSSSLPSSRITSPALASRDPPHLFLPHGTAGYCPLRSIIGSPSFSGKISVLYLQTPSYRKTHNTELEQIIGCQDALDLLPGYVVVRTARSLCRASKTISSRGTIPQPRQYSSVKTKQLVTAQTSSYPQEVCHKP